MFSSLMATSYQANFPYCRLQRLHTTLKLSLSYLHAIVRFRPPTKRWALYTPSELHSDRCYNHLEELSGMNRRSQWKSKLQTPSHSVS